jgi:drug/metabolite transporter (DMT)-like permease
LAIGVPFVADSGWYADQFDSTAPGSWAFVSVFFILGIGQSTYIRNEQPYALRQVHDLTLYPATNLLLNITLVISAFAALLGAAIIRASSIDTLLVVAAALAFVALISTALLQGRRKLRRRYLEPELRGPRQTVRNRKRRRRKRR